MLFGRTEWASIIGAHPVFLCGPDAEMGRRGDAGGKSKRRVGEREKRRKPKKKSEIEGECRLKKSVLPGFRFQPFPQDAVDEGGVGLAPREPHGGAHKEPEGLDLAHSVLGHRPRVLFDNSLDESGHLFL